MSDETPTTETSKVKESFARLLTSAEAGDAQSQYELGTCYEKGTAVVSKDDVESVKWYLRAAESYRKLAEKDDSIAQYKLARMYHRGTGVAKDSTEASRWIALAVPSIQRLAYKGHTELEFTLYLVFERGEGLPRNRALAYKWLNRAKQHRCALADLHAAFFGSGSHIADVIKDGDSAELTSLGQMYLEGDGVEQNKVKAEQCLRKAAEQEHAEAQYLLSQLYLRQSRRVSAGVKWLIAAAENGFPRAQITLGNAYFNGYHRMSWDIRKALYWWEKAGAFHLLGDYYYSCSDYAKALLFYKKAVHRCRSYSNIGRIYQHGSGTSRDELAAVLLFKYLAEVKAGDFLIEENRVDAYAWIKVARLIRGHTVLKNTDWEAGMTPEMMMEGNRRYKLLRRALVLKQDELRKEFPGWAGPIR